MDVRIFAVSISVCRQVTSSGAIASRVASLRSTLLQVEPLLQNRHFRRAVLTQLGPPVSNHDWWTGYYGGSALT